MLDVYGHHSTTALTLQEVVDQCSGGGGARSLQLPTFQRPFVWKDPKIQRLVDSIYLGYPVGYLTVFKPKGDSSSLAAWLEEGDEEAAAESGWLIDGQQRSTALCIIHDKKPRWVTEEEWEEMRRRVLFDPATAKTRVLKMNSGKPRSGEVQVSELLRWGEDTVNDQFKEQQAGRLLRLRKQLQQSTVGEIGFQGTASQAVEIFKRLNQEGERVSSWDLTLTSAALWRPEWVRDVVRTAHAEVRKSMPKLKLADLMRPFAAIWMQTTRTGQLLEAGEADWSAEEVDQAWASTSRGWTRTADYLRSRGILVRGNVQVPVSYLLPLVVLFSFEESQKDVGEAPLWWLIGAMKQGRYKSGSTNNIDAVAGDLVEILSRKGFEEGMAYLWSTQQSMDFSEEEFQREQPATQVLFQDLVIAALTSREYDWSPRPTPMDPSAVVQQVHHIYPKDWVRQNLPSRRSEALQYANLTVISAEANGPQGIGAKSPRVYLAETEGWHRTALASHFVTQDMVRSVTSSEDNDKTMDAFLQARAAGLANEARRQYEQARRGAA